VFLQFANADDDALRSAIRARINKKDRGAEIDEDAVFRALTGDGAPEDDYALRTFTLMLLENETKRFRDKTTGDGPGKKRNPNKLELQQRIRTAVDAKRAKNGLPLARNFQIVAEAISKEIQRLEEAGESPREWSDYFNPTETAIRDLYYGD
jgi:hypothetical protein